MGAKTAWGWAAVGAAVVLAVAVAVGELWTSFGPSRITPAGWVAMALGIIVTLGLGIGLMTLVFVSNRRGYDERRDC